MKEDNRDISILSVCEWKREPNGEYILIMKKTKDDIKSRIVVKNKKERYEESDVGGVFDCLFGEEENFFGLFEEEDKAETLVKEEPDNSKVEKEENNEENISLINIKPKNCKTKRNISFVIVGKQKVHKLNINIDPNFSFLKVRNIVSDLIDYPEEKLKLYFNRQELQLDSIVKDFIKENNSKIYVALVPSEGKLTLKTSNEFDWSENQNYISIFSTNKSISIDEIGISMDESDIFSDRKKPIEFEMTIFEQLADEDFVKIYHNPKIIAKADDSFSKNVYYFKIKPNPLKIKPSTKYYIKYKSISTQKIQCVKNFFKKINVEGVTFQFHNLEDNLFLNNITDASTINVEIPFISFSILSNYLE